MKKYEVFVNKDSGVGTVEVRAESVSLYFEGDTCRVEFRVGADMVAHFFGIYGYRVVPEPTPAP